jgi:hypothetical protein
MAFFQELQREGFPVSHDPYAPPGAAVGDVLVPDTQEPALFAVSLKKLAVMSVCTLGMYEVYWFWSHWRHLQRRQGGNFSAALRTVLAFLFWYPCFRRMSELGRRHGVPGAAPIALVAAAWLALMGCTLLPRPWYSLILLGILGRVYLLPMQAWANRVNAAMTPRAGTNARLRGWNWVAVALGMPFVALMVVGTFLRAVR